VARSRSKVADLVRLDAAADEAAELTAPMAFSAAAPTCLRATGSATK
jgi:hypothetical protein